MGFDPSTSCMLGRCSTICELIPHTVHHNIINLIWQCTLRVREHLPDFSTVPCTINKPLCTGRNSWRLTRDGMIYIYQYIDVSLCMRGQCMYRYQLLYINTFCVQCYWYPIQKYIFAVKKGKAKKVQVTEWLKGVISLWGQECYQTVYNIIACKTNLTKAVHLLQAK